MVLVADGAYANSHFFSERSDFGHLRIPFTSGVGAFYGNADVSVVWTV